MDLEITEVETSEVMSDIRAIKFTCVDSAQTKHTLTIRFAAVMPFLTGLASTPMDSQGQPDSGYIHPLHPRGARAFRLHNGEIGLSFVIADRVELPMAFPKQAIPEIRKQLDALENL